jgi:hypothetical protein
MAEALERPLENEARGVIVFRDQDLHCGTPGISMISATGTGANASFNRFARPSRYSLVSSAPGLAGITGPPPREILE